MGRAAGEYTHRGAGTKITERTRVENAVARDEPTPEPKNR